MFAVRYVTAATAAMLVWSAAAGAARAEVIYRVEQVAFGSLGFDAALTRADFITSDIAVPISDFVVTVNADSFTTVTFEPHSTSGLIGGCRAFGQPTPCDMVTLSDPGGISPFYIAPDAFVTPAVYTAASDVFSWTVTVSGSPSVVPETPTWAMLLAGFAGLGFAGYRARQRLVEPQV